MKPSITDLQIPGGWRRLTVQVESRQFQLTVPADPDQLLEGLTEEVESVQTPPPIYWAAMWSAAVPTASAVLRGTWPRQQRALEIGCGIGLVGLAGLAAGLQVTFSDAVPTAVQLAVENAHQNGFPDVECMTLDWWRGRPDATFPVILASDVLYERQDHESVVRLLSGILTAQGVCWIGDPGRAYTGDFIELATRAGFDVRLFDDQDQPISEPLAGAFQRLVLRRTSGRGRRA